MTWPKLQSKILNPSSISFCNSLELPCLGVEDKIEQLNIDCEQIHAVPCLCPHDTCNTCTGFEMKRANAQVLVSFGVNRKCLGQKSFSPAEPSAIGSCSGGIIIIA